LPSLDLLSLEAVYNEMECQQRPTLPLRLQNIFWKLIQEASSRRCAKRPTWCCLALLLNNVGKTLYKRLVTSPTSNAFPTKVVKETM